MNVLTLASLMKLGLIALWSDVTYSVYWYAKFVAISFLSATTIMVLCITYNTQQTNYTIITTTTNTGVAYRHSHDTRTTGIINYLTGRGPLPETERLPLYRQYIKNRLEEAHMKVPEHFTSYTMEKVDAVAVDWYRHTFPSGSKDPETIRRLLDGLFENAIQPPLGGFTSNVHDNMWHLLRDVGSPRIRWVEEQDDDFSRLIVAYSENDKRAFYNPANHTIYISYDDAPAALFDEVGHAKQFRDHPYQSHFRMIGSMLTALIEGGFNLKTAQAVYGLRYSREDTFEGEAHIHIKRQLLEEHGLKNVGVHAPEKS